MKANWSVIIAILVFAFGYYVWLFVSSERGQLTLKARRFEKAKDPAEFKFEVRLMAYGGLVFWAAIIYFYGIKAAQQ